MIDLLTIYSATLLISDAKYLDIQIDNKLDWNKHISTVAARVQSKLAGT